MNTAITITDLHKSYTRGGETLEVLQGVDMEIGEGEFLALTGPSAISSYHPAGLLKVLGFAGLNTGVFAGLAETPNPGINTRRPTESVRN